MKENNEHIDKIFRDGLNPYEVQPPELIWETVQNHIANGNKKRGLPVYYKWAAGIALFIASSASIYFLSKTPHPTQLADKKTDVMETPELNQISPEKPDAYLAELKEKEQKPEQKISISNDVPVLKTSTTTQISEKTASESRMDPLGFIHQKYLTPRHPKFDIEKRYDIQPASFLSIASEEKTQKSSFFSGWEAGINIMPKYSYRVISSSQNFASSVSYLNQSEYGKVSYSAELNLRKRISGRISIRSGIQFANLGFKTGNIAYIEGLDKLSDLPAATITRVSPFLNLSTSAGTVRNNSEKVILNQINSISQIPLSTVYPALSFDADTDANLIQNFYYLGVPLDAILRLGTSKKLYLRLGFQIDFLLNNRVHLANSDGSKNYIGNVKGLNKINYSTSAGFGFEYPLNHKLRLTVEPVFNIFLTPINKNHFISARPYSFGIAIGINLPS